MFTEISRYQIKITPNPGDVDYRFEVFAHYRRPSTEEQDAGAIWRTADRITTGYAPTMYFAQTSAENVIRRQMDSTNYLDYSISVY